MNELQSYYDFLARCQRAIEYDPDDAKARAIAYMVSTEVAAVELNLMKSGAMSVQKN